MTDPFVGEIRINAFNYAPKSWALCDGQKMTIQQNAALYSLIGAYFGGDRSTYFNLPDLRGRVPVGYATRSVAAGLSTYNMGKNGGLESVALTVNQTPFHDHEWQAVTTPGDSKVPTGNFYAQTPAGVNIYTTPAATPVALHPKVMSDVGGGAGHNTMQPFAVLSFCIALLGYYPPRT